MNYKTLSYNLYIFHCYVCPHIGFGFRGSFTLIILHFENKFLSRFSKKRIVFLWFNSIIIYSYNYLLNKYNTKFDGSKYSKQNWWFIKGSELFFKGRRERSMFVWFVKFEDWVNQKFCNSIGILLYFWWDRLGLIFLISHCIYQIIKSFWSFIWVEPIYDMKNVWAGLRLILL